MIHFNKHRLHLALYVVDYKVKLYGANTFRRVNDASGFRVRGIAEAEGRTADLTRRIISRRA